MTDPNRLIDRYFDDLLTKDEFDQVEQDIANNARYADAFAHAMLLDALLKEQFERETIAESIKMSDGSFLDEADLKHLQDDYDHASVNLVTIVEPDKKARSKRHHPADDLSMGQAVSVLAYGLKRFVQKRPGPFIGSAIAAMLLLALWLINPFAPSDEPIGNAGLADTTQQPDKPRSYPTYSVATLTAEHNAVWSTPAAAASAVADLSPGSPLHPGDRLTLTQGFAEITTHAGAIAILQAPATIELLDNDNALRLHSGKLVGICETESSKGLLVRTLTWMSSTWARALASKCCLTAGPRSTSIKARSLCSTSWPTRPQAQARACLRIRRSAWAAARMS